MADPTLPCPGGECASQLRRLDGIVVVTQFALATNLWSSTPQVLRHGHNKNINNNNDINNNHKHLRKRKQTKTTEHINNGDRTNNNSNDINKLARRHVKPRKCGTRQHLRKASSHRLRATVRPHATRPVALGARTAPNPSPTPRPSAAPPVSSPQRRMSCVFVSCLDSRS